MEWVNTKRRRKLKKQPFADVLQIFLKVLKIFTGKHLRWSLFLIKLQALRPVTLSKRDSNTNKRFLVKFANFLKISILKNICERLVLKVIVKYLLRSSF